MRILSHLNFSNIFMSLTLYFGTQRKKRYKIRRRKTYDSGTSSVKLLALTCCWTFGPGGRGLVSDVPQLWPKNFNKHTRNKFVRLKKKNWEKIQAKNALAENKIYDRAIRKTRFRDIYASCFKNLKMMKQQTKNIRHYTKLSQISSQGFYCKPKIINLHSLE